MFPDITNLAEYRTGWTNTVATSPGIRHNHQYIELDYHKNGRGNVTVESSGSYDFDAGYLEIVPATWYHTQRQDLSGTDCCILFEISSAWHNLLGSCISLKLREGDFAAQEIQSLALLPKPTNSAEMHICNLRLTAVLMNVLTYDGVMKKESRALSRREQLAAETYDYIRAHWRDLRTIQQIAENLNASGDYLRHVFYEKYNKTVYDFLTQMRIDHAKELLANSQLPQKQIARVCGFADIQQFSRRFRQITHMAPGQYRSNAAADER